MSEQMREALKLADAALSGANMNMSVVKRKIAEALAQPEHNVEVRLSPEDEAEQFIQAAIDKAPEPLRRLGKYLTHVLDEDQWKTAEGMLLGAATAPPAPALPDAAQRVEYCWSRDEESPFAGPHDSAEEAALEALTGTDYDGVYIGERADIDFDGLVDEDSLIETMMCRAGDEVGEVAEDWLSAITQADRNALKAAILPIIKAWVDERDPIRFWRVVNVRYVNREDVQGADQLDDDAEPEAARAPR